MLANRRTGRARESKDNSVFQLRARESPTAFAYKSSEVDLLNGWMDEGWREPSCFVLCGFPFDTAEASDGKQRHRLHEEELLLLWSPGLPASTAKALSGGGGDGILASVKVEIKTVFRYLVPCSTW